MKLEDWKAIGISIIMLLIGFFAMFAVKRFISIENGLVYVSVLLIPAIFYMVMSGKIKEIKAPGGLEAKFAVEAFKPITDASENIGPSISEMNNVEKQELQALEKIRNNIDESKPIVMTMVLREEMENSIYYDRSATLRYIEILSQFNNFKFVVFLDSKNQFLGYMPSWAMKDLLNNKVLGDEFIRIFNGGYKHKLFSFPGVAKETISTKTTNAVALREMTDKHLEALVVIDENRLLKGVVEREQILSRMMLALTR